MTLDDLQINLEYNIRYNKKLQAIKDIKEVFDIGLKQCKDIIDEYWFSDKPASSANVILDEVKNKYSKIIKSEDTNKLIILPSGINKVNENNLQVFEQIKVKLKHNKRVFTNKELLFLQEAFGIISEEAFEKILKAHNWTYEFSDDSRVYKLGVDSAKRINDILKEYPYYQKIYDKFKK